MSRSLAYAANTQDQVIGAGGVINFGNAIRRYGCNCNISGGNATVKGNGYYTLSAAVTLLATAAGTTVITLYKNGVAIPGATASATLVAGNVYQLNTPAAVTRETGCGCADASTITAVVSGTGFTATNAAITVVKE